MCFPYPHAAQAINGRDTLTATFQGRRTHARTDSQSEVGAPPGGTRRGSMARVGRMSSDCGEEGSETAAVTSSRKLRTKVAPLVSRAEPFTAYKKRTELSFIYFERRQVDASISFANLIVGRATEEVIDEASVPPLRV